MAEALIRRSPLAAFDLAPAEDNSDGLQIVELPGRTHINIRLDGDDRKAAAALKRATGLTLPKPCTYSADDSSYLGWISPDEWLYVSDESDSAAKVADVAAKLTKVHHAVNDLSSAQTIVRLTGPGAARTLAKGCTLDLHADVFVAPAFAQTRIAKTQATVRAVDVGAYDVIVRRSFADYFWTWLMRAAADASPDTGTA